MSIKNGIVKKVYIPNDSKDIMLSNKIGFVVEIDGKLYKYEAEQNEVNSEIMKNDRIELIAQIIDNKRFIDIKKIGDDNEQL